MKNPCGRPLKFRSVEEWTITGLALALDTSRKVLVEYEDREKFGNTIKKAKLMVENGYELDLKKYGRSGTIFALKNFDWKDTTEQNVNLKATLTLEQILLQVNERKHLGSGGELSAESTEIHSGDVETDTPTDKTGISE